MLIQPLQQTIRDRKWEIFGQGAEVPLSKVKGIFAPDEIVTNRK
jgi:hypothetical protein